MTNTSNTHAYRPIGVLDSAEVFGQSPRVTSYDAAAEKRSAALRLLQWDNSAVVEDATTILVLERTVEAMALVCEALAMFEKSKNTEEQENILWAISPLWKSGEVEVVPSLLREVRVSGNEQARLGAVIALEWLHIDA